MTGEKTVSMTDEMRYGHCLMMMYGKNPDDKTRMNAQLQVTKFQSMPPEVKEKVLNIANACAMLGLEYNQFIRVLDRAYGPHTTGSLEVGISERVTGSARAEAVGVIQANLHNFNVHTDGNTLIISTKRTLQR